MTLNIFNTYIFAAVSVFLPLIFAIFLIVKRLKLSYVKKNILNHGFCVVSFVSLVLFLLQKFLAKPFELNFDIFIIDKTALKIGLLFDNTTAVFLIFTSLLYFLVSLFLKEYFKRKKQFVFTKQRFYIFLSLLCFFTYLFLAASNLFQSFVFWVLSGVLIYVFSYFDIFKKSADFNLNRFYRILLLGDFSYLTFIFILFKYAYLSNNELNLISLDFSSLNVLLSYCFGISSSSESFLAGFCLTMALISRFFMFPLNCFYSFFVNSSSALYVPVLTCSNCILGSYLFIKTIPYLELFYEYKLYFEIFVGLTILTSLLFILFEKNLKIIFGHVLSVFCAFFVIFYMNFSHKIALWIYFISILIVLFILIKFFLSGKTSLNSRIIKKYKGFILEKTHIFVFERLLIKISSFFNCIDEKIVQNIIKFPVFVFEFLTTFFVVKLSKRNSEIANLRNIIIVFVLLALFAIGVSLLVNFWEI